MSEGRWATVAAFTTAIEAHAAKTKLESEGIECFVADEQTVGVNPLYSNAIGGVRVQVAPADLERAKAALGHPTRVEADRFNDTEAIRCPKCGSEELEKQPFSNKVSAIAWLLASLALMLPFPWLSRRTWKCRGCGATFRSDSPRRK